MKSSFKKIFGVLMVLSLAVPIASRAGGDDSDGDVPVTNIEAVFRCKARAVGGSHSEVRYLEIWTPRGADNLVDPDGMASVVLLDRHEQILEFLPTSSRALNWNPAYVGILASDDSEGYDAEIGSVSVDLCKKKGRLTSFVLELPDLRLTRCEYIIVPQ